MNNIKKQKITRFYSIRKDPDSNGKFGVYSLERGFFVSGSETKEAAAIFCKYLNKEANRGLHDML